MLYSYWNTVLSWIEAAISQIFNLDRIQIQAINSNPKVSIWIEAGLPKAAAMQLLFNTWLRSASHQAP